MSLDLTAQEVNAIWTEAEQHCPPATSIDRLEAICTVPSRLGSGYQREMELYPGLELCIFNKTYYNNLTVRVPENRHLVQFMIVLSGVSDGGDLVLINAEQSYVGGSGMQRIHRVFTPQSQPQVGVNIHMQPPLLSQFFAAPTGELPAELQPLVRGDDWQRVFSPKTTGTMRSVVQQIIDCPFCGIIKRFYLQGKMFELMALQLDSIVRDDVAASDRSLKPNTIARIHYAAEIL